MLGLLDVLMGFQSFRSLAVDLGSHDGGIVHVGPKPCEVRLHLVALWTHTARLLRVGVRFHPLRIMLAAPKLCLLGFDVVRIWLELLRAFLVLVGLWMLRLRIVDEEPHATGAVVAGVRPHQLGSNVAAPGFCHSGVLITLEGLPLHGVLAFCLWSLPARSNTLGVRFYSPRPFPTSQVLPPLRPSTFGLWPKQIRALVADLGLRAAGLSAVITRLLLLRIAVVGFWNEPLGELVTGSGPRADGLDHVLAELLSARIQLIRICHDTA